VETSLAKASIEASECAQVEQEQHCWSNALRYVGGQRDVLKQASDSALRTFRREIQAALKTEEGQATPTLSSSAASPRPNGGSGSDDKATCATVDGDVAADTTVLSVPWAECISVDDARGSAVEAGEAFQQAIKHPSIAGAIDDETAMLLFILAAAAQPPVPGRRWQSLWTMALSPTAPPPTTAGQNEDAAVAGTTSEKATAEEEEEDDAMVLELRGIHEALFPALSNAFPAAFPADAFTVSCCTVLRRILPLLDIVPHC